MKNILVIGATGAMGIYLTKELLSMGYAVDGITCEEADSYDKNLTYIKADAMKDETLKELLKKDYAAIVDFMIYPNVLQFEKRHTLFLSHTDHYIFLSTYRVYSDRQLPITESCPRLLDVSEDESLLYTNDYSIYKAQEEDILRRSGADNYTIVRPAITYSRKKYQLTILEAPLVIARMCRGKRLILPGEALDKQATMSWGGDVGKMIARLVLNKKAFRQVYTTSTSEHHTWREIAQMYHRIGNLEYIGVDTETFLNIFAPGNIGARQQLCYDRLFDRVVDNAEILNITGIQPAELMPLEEGLRKELSQINPIKDIPLNGPVSERMDAYLKTLR